MAPRTRRSCSSAPSASTIAGKWKASGDTATASTSRRTQSKSSHHPTPLPPPVVQLSGSPSPVQSLVPAASPAKNPPPATTLPLVAYSASDSSASHSDSSTSVSKTLTPSNFKAPAPPVDSVTPLVRSIAQVVLEPPTAPADAFPSSDSANAPTSTPMSAFKIGSSSSLPPDSAPPALPTSRAPSPSSPPHNTVNPTHEDLDHEDFPALCKEDCLT